MTRFCRLIAIGSMIFTSACGGSADEGVNTPLAEVPVDTADADLPPGDISVIGTIVVADDQGELSDIVASFFRIEQGVSRNAVTALYPPVSPICDVDNGSPPDFGDISATFLPDIAARGDSVGAGDAVVLSENIGTYATLFRQGVGEFVFYGITSGDVLPDGAPPTQLQASITGDEFPAFNAPAFPQTDPLQDFDFTSPGADQIDSTTEFSWSETADTNSMIKLSSSTSGGFFLESSQTVTCLVSDNGFFAFPAATRTALGTEFRGSRPTVSRVSVNSYIEGNAVLFLVRESFAD